MKTIKITPNDLLFCKDARPMTGEYIGMGDNFPSPLVLNYAFRVALNRLEEEKGHIHCYKDKNKRRGDRDRRFGSFKSFGAFPFDGKNIYLPAPLDLMFKKEASEIDRITISPIAKENIEGFSHLPENLHPCATSGCPDKKHGAAKWFSVADYNSYIESKYENIKGAKDSDFFDTEYSTCTAIDNENLAARKSTEQKAQWQFSKAQLRFKENVSMIAFAEFKKSHEKENKGENEPEKDIVEETFKSINKLNLGGEARMSDCEIIKDISLPHSMDLSDLKAEEDGTFLIKYILLSPAVFPYIKANPEKGIKEHKGGWLPNWVEEDSFKVKLPKSSKNRERGSGLAKNTTEFINARLISAVIAKNPMIVSGYSNGYNGNGKGHKSTLLAVNAGSVYFFEAATKEDAEALVNALSWDRGDKTATEIKNLRSSLFGEKGFGLGICTLWQWQEIKKPQEDTNQ